MISSSSSSLSVGTLFRFAPAVFARPNMPVLAGVKAEAILFVVVALLLPVDVVLALVVLLNGRAVLSVDATRGTWLGR